MASLKFVAAADFDAASPLWTAFFRSSGNYTEASYSATQWSLVGTASSGLEGYKVVFSGAFTRPPAGGVPNGTITGFAVYDASGAELYEGSGYAQSPQAVVAHPNILFDQPNAQYADTVQVTLTSGNDRITGGAAPIVVLDSAGSDTITGGTGGATISFAALAAGVQIDLSRTSAQSAGLGILTLNNVHGVVGTSYGDTITGSQGKDSIYGGGGADVIDAGVGNDVIVLGAYNGASTGTVVHGGVGDDTITYAAFAREFDDTLHGDDGNDTIHANNLGGQTGAGSHIYGDDGNDLLIVDGYNPSARSNYGGSGHVLDGGAGNDTFTGWAAGNTLVGGSGDDVFAFDDYRYVRVGYSSVAGGDGYDILSVDSGSAQTQLSFLTVYLGGNAPSSGDGIIAATGIEEVRVSVGTSNSVDRAEPLPVYVYGGAENDVVVGSGTVGVTIDGGGGNDTITGTGGNDTITTGNGDDQIFGGAGTDLIVGGGGRDIIFGDNVSGDTSGGNDTLIGNAGDDVIYGGYGNDWITGNQDNDVLAGNQGDDTIYGGQGNDTIYGGQGSDMIFGGLGNDTLIGGLGNDRFVFQASFAHDTINDFGAANGNNFDTIQFASGTFANYADVQSHMAQQGSSVVITLDAADDIVLLNTSMAALTSDHFLFA